MNHIITKEQFYELENEESLTITRHKELVSLISNRINYILETTTSKLKWWDFLTGGDWDDDCEGAIEDSLIYAGEISLRGEFSFKPNDIVGDNSIPIEWLWEDFEEEFEKSIEDFKRKTIDKKEKSRLVSINRKEHLVKMKKIIEDKLTKEELKCINFKK